MDKKTETHSLLTPVGMTVRELFSMLEEGGKNKKKAMELALELEAEKMENKLLQSSLKAAESALAEKVAQLEKIGGNSEEVPEDWIKHEGNECPVDPETLVLVILNEPDVYGLPTDDMASDAGGWWWDEPKDSDGRITHYKIIKPENDWIEWDGGKRPVKKETKVQVRLRRGSESTKPFEAKKISWSHTYYHRSYDVVAYRVVND